MFLGMRETTHVTLMFYHEVAITTSVFDGRSVDEIEACVIVIVAYVTTR